MLLDHRRPRGRAHAGGSTLVEIGVAMLLFLVVAGAVTAAAVRAVGRDAQAQLEQQAAQAVEGLLAQLEADGYDAALGASSSTSLPGCPDGPGVCVHVGPHRDRPVAFDVTVQRDTSLGTAATSVLVVATVELPGGLTVSRSSRVVAPGSGFAPGQRGVARVVFDGPAPDQALLVDSDTEAVVGSADVVGDTAVVVVPPVGCTALDPCRLALLGQAPYFTVDGVGLDLGSVSRLVTTTSGAVTDVAAFTHVSGEATISLSATNPASSQTGAPQQAGSVCLWAQLPTGEGVPLCNSDDPGFIEAGSHPLPGRPDLRISLPAGVVLPVGTDHPDGGCPEVAGAVGHRSGGWQQLAVCTSWTWGHPTTWQEGSSAAVDFSGAQMTLPTDGTPGSYQAAWTAGDAQPATGLTTQPVWAKPREAPGCADDASCAGLDDGEHPEATACPGAHCLSVATLAPRLTAPRRGSHQVAVEPMSSSAGKKTFPLSFEDADGDLVTVTLTEVPTSGSLRRGTGGPVIAQGEVLLTFTGTGTINVEFDKSSGGPQLNRFELLIDDGTEQVVQRVGVSQTEFGWSVVSDDVLVAAQGTSGHQVQFLLVGTNGEPKTSTTTAVEVVRLADESVLSSTTVTTDGTGTGTVDVDLTSDPPAGDYEIRVLASDTPISGDGTPGIIDLEVLPTAGSLVVDAPDVVQGANATVTASAVDRAGDPMQGAVVRLSLPGAPAGVSLAATKCVTDATGSCQVELLTDSASQTGAHTLEAASGAFVVTDPFQVSPVVASVAADDVAIAPGATVVVEVTASDGSGAGAGGAVVASSTSSADLSLPATATAGPDGVASFAVTADAGASSGTATVTFTSGDAAVAVEVAITTEPFSVSADPTALSVPRNGSGTVVVTVLDDQGEAVPGVRVSSETDRAGVAVDAFATTDAGGQATFTVRATSRDAAVQVTFSSGAADATTDVTVEDPP